MTQECDRCGENISNEDRSVTHQIVTRRVFHLPFGLEFKCSNDDDVRKWTLCEECFNGVKRYLR